jgi:hypothetical protein
MSRFLIKLLFLCCLLLSVADAQEKKTPQILFLGDSVHQTIVQAAAKELGDKVSMNYPPRGIQAEDSGTALANLEELLQKKDWDIIYFNYGIGDLCHKDPSTREFRIMSKDAGGVRVSTPEQYEKQLDALVQELKKTNAKLIWGSTTPMAIVHFFPSFLGNLFDANAEQEYNTIAARVMKKHKVLIVDIHGHIMAQFKPEDKHPPYTGYAGEMAKRGKPIHTPLVQALQSALGKP